MKTNSRLAIIFILSLSFLCGRAIAVLAYSVSSSPSVSNSDITIVIDPGHGGNDPGKVSASGLLEKDINLEISKQLETLLKKNGFNVILTREKDIHLSKDKSNDLAQRVQTMSKDNVDMVISIHQNSYTSCDSSGPQVFYYSYSDEGCQLAASISASVNSSLKPDKPRQIQANSNYYILKNTSNPIVIVECGFLSNPTEAELLSDSSYQQKLACAIYLGIVNYLNQPMS